MAQGNPLNAPTGTNNLLALVLQKASQGRGDVAYCDTGEPTKTTITVTTSSVIQINFPLNGAGNQPPVSQGAWGMIGTALSTATAGVSIVIEAVDTTATTGGHTEWLSTVAPANGDSFARTLEFVSSLAAGADKVTGLTNVIGLRATITMTTTGGGMAFQFAASGTP